MTILSGIDRLALWGIGLITTSEKKQRALHQLFKFCCIGVINTAIDFALYYVLTRYTPYFNPTTPAKYIANVISFFTAATFSFFANRLWTFTHRHPITAHELARFYSANISGIIFNSAILLLCVKLLAVHDLVGKLIATIFTIGWNFMLQKFWVFKTKHTVQN